MYVSFISGSRAISAAVIYYYCYYYLLIYFLTYFLAYCVCVCTDGDVGICQFKSSDTRNLWNYQGSVAFLQIFCFTLFILRTLL